MPQPNVQANRTRPSGSRIEATKLQIYVEPAKEAKGGFRFSAMLGPFFASILPGIFGSEVERLKVRLCWVFYEGLIFLACRELFDDQSDGQS
jgi:hypothetical protein